MNDCIVPTDRKFDDDGYPRIKIKKRLWRMNRWMWTIVNGPIPEGLVVAHHCNNKGCINPNHFYLATPEENSTHAARDSLYRVGQEHGRAKVTDEQVEEIIRLYEGGMSQEKVGEKFGLSQSQVSYIVRRKRKKSIV